MASLTKNPNVNKWVEEMIALTKPDKVVWIDGSEEQLEELRSEACCHRRDDQAQRGKASRLLSAPHRCSTTLPAWRTAPSSAAKKEEDAGPTNNWMDPEEMYAKLHQHVRRLL